MLCKNLWERPDESESIEPWEDKHIQITASCYYLFPFTTFSNGELGSCLENIMCILCRLADEKVMYEVLENDMVGDLAWMSSVIGSNTEENSRLIKDIEQRLEAVYKNVA